ncbi:MAG: hypothetical protein KIH67_000340 [Candidatus Moranbacteria bacterium]|nr:hypothetical protein [Candidatus Moranbacteria bacterium]
MERFQFETFETHEWQKVADKSKMYGPLALTAEDHRVLMSTPPEEMLQSPKSSYFEILSPEELETFLDEYLASLEEALIDKRIRENGFAKIYLQDLEASFRYLDSLNARPEKYRDISLDEIKAQLGL